MKTLTRLQSVLFILAISLTFLVQNTINAEPIAKDLTKTFTLNGPGELEVKTSGGFIHVEGQNGNKVTVTMIVKKRGRELDAESAAWDDALEDYEITIEKRGNTVVAMTERKNKSGWNWKNSASISFEITAPHQVKSNLKTSGGGINLSNVEGYQYLKTSGGRLEMSNIQGDIDGTTSGGGITAENLDGNLNLKTSGGKISITDATGKIDATTSGGGITLHNTVGDVDVSTSGGGIRIDGEASAIRATTSGGGIHANVKGVSESLYLKTSGGSIHATLDGSKGMDLDLKGNNVKVQLKNFSGTSKKNHVDGTMNGGGMPVYMHTSGGSVTCEFN